jgi:beta-glucosidase/6-phospho-beta-glucosidase/beta-galactosidase
MISECGTTDNGAIGSNDANRITYFRGHLNEVLKAIVKDGCKVKGFTAYSLLDGFDLPAGYA